MKHKHKMAVVWVCVSVIVLGLAFIFYQMFLDGTGFNPIVTHQMPLADLMALPSTGTFDPNGAALAGSYSIMTDKSTYHPGDYVFVYFDLCIYRNVTPMVQWYFVNDIAQALTPRRGTLGVLGCYKNIKVMVATVPDEFGQYSTGNRYRLYAESCETKIVPMGEG